MVHWSLETVLLVLLLSAAMIALKVKDLLAAVITLGVFSFLCALVFVAMGAVDVAFTEAVVGAGVTTVLFVIALYNTTRRSAD